MRRAKRNRPGTDEQDERVMYVQLTENISYLKRKTKINDATTSRPIITISTREKVGNEDKGEVTIMIMEIAHYTTLQILYLKFLTNEPAPCTSLTYILMIMTVRNIATSPELMEAPLNHMTMYSEIHCYV